METDFGLLPSDLATIRGILKKDPKIEQALIFGSRAKGNYRPGSDVDIALKGEQLAPENITDVSMELNEETIMPYRFDVLNYHTIAEPALIDHINRIGIVFYEKSN
jgi:predicted nucleotidyltransferase